MEYVSGAQTFEFTMCLLCMCVGVLVDVGVGGCVGVGHDSAENK